MRMRLASSQATPDYSRTFPLHGKIRLACEINHMQQHSWVMAHIPSKSPPALTSDIFEKADR